MDSDTGCQLYSHTLDELADLPAYSDIPQRPRLVSLLVGNGVGNPGFVALGFSPGYFSSAGISYTAPFGATTMGAALAQALAVTLSAVVLLVISVLLTDCA